MCAVRRAARYREGSSAIRQKRGAQSAPHTFPPPTTLNPAVESGKRDSNPRPQPWQGCALPTELFPQSVSCYSEADTPGSQTPTTLHGDRTMLSWHSSDPNCDEASDILLLCHVHGGERDRTADLLNAIQALSQLSYAPSSQLTSSAQHRVLQARRKSLSPGTTKYSPGYTECQRIGTGENLIGRYFAAPYVTWVDTTFDTHKRSAW